MNSTYSRTGENGTITEIPGDIHWARIGITDEHRSLKRCRATQWPVRWIQRIVDLLENRYHMDDATDISCIDTVTDLEDRRINS